MRYYLLIFAFILFINCSSSIELINNNRNQLFSKEQLSNNFTKGVLKYQDENRDSVFSQNNLLKINDFIFFELQSMVDGNYSGCFISKKKTMGFWKESYFDKLEYEECDFFEYIDYLANTSKEQIEECSIRNPAEETTIIYLTKLNKRKVTVKKIQYFDIEQCIIEQNMKN